MFAIIKTGGKQYRVQEGDVLSVGRLPSGPGTTTLLDQVLLIGDGNETLIGTPLLEKAAVRAAVMEDFKDDKIIVFKKKRRKQFRRTRGHRQEMTRIKILNIVTDAALLPLEEAVEPEPKPEQAPVTAGKTAAKPTPRETPAAAKPRKKPAAAKPKTQKKAAKPKKKEPARASPKRKAR
jgi:large subunit ribosomal protein L21